MTTALIFPLLLALGLSGLALAVVTQEDTATIMSSSESTSRGTTTGITTAPVLEGICTITVCENGGSCVVDTVTKKERCDCPSGLTGPTCQFEDYCLSSPCPADADCRVNSHGETECICPPDLQDLRCFTENSTTLTPPTTPTIVCTKECINGGVCVIDTVNGDRCVCPKGYTGQLCETSVDYCLTNRCPSGATCLNDASNTLGYICVCPGDFKGPNCTEADPMVSCRDFERLLYLELIPSQDDRTICVPRVGSTTDDICYDKSETLTYKTSPIDDTRVRIDEYEDQYCAVYYVDDATTPKYCVKLTAYEEDDMIIRPWRNSNATVCYVFNRKPEFIGPPDINYNLPDMDAVELYDVNATDPDTHQTLSFTITEVSAAEYASLISVSSDGLLETTKPSSIPNDPYIVDVMLKIEDNGIPALNISRILKVKFTDRQLLCNVNKNPIYVQSPMAGVPDGIGRLICQPLNPDIIFSLQGDGDLSGFFSVNASGFLFLKTLLPAGNYSFNVTAEIQQPVRVATQLSVIIKIGNWLPACSPDLQPFTMTEDAGPGTCSDIVYTCLNPSGEPWNCFDNGSSLFRLECPSVREGENITFKICTNTTLKGRVGRQQVNLTLANRFGKTLIELEANIENVNDKPNITKGAVYVFAIPETTTVGSSIGKLSVSDPDLLVEIDPSEVLTAEITAPSDETVGQASYPFNASVNSAQDAIEIYVTDRLDASVSQRYQFSVKVTDRGGLSDSVPVTVNVSDVNEPPTCVTTTYENVSVSVKDQPDKVVVALACSDRDVQLQFKQLFYEIRGNKVVLDHFRVNASGMVMLRRSLADVTDSSLTIAVNVSDGAGLSVLAVITVVISSDFPPVCSNSDITTSKSENTAVNVCFSVESGCSDPVKSLPLRFEILSGDGLDLFRLENTTTSGNNIGLCTKASLKNKYGEWTLIGRAVSEFGTTPITVVISVSDTNDPPQFEQTMYSVTVVENSPIGHNIIQIKATDPDSGALGQITYSSDGIDSSSLFDLNSNDGWITVKGLIDADIAGRPSNYTFIVQAVDGGPPHDPVVQTSVKISVLDVNDNSPSCSNPQSSIPLFLLTPVKETVYTVVCSDADRSPQFRQLRYNMKSQSATDVFSIDESGVIRLEQTLPRDAVQYNISIVVDDSDDPAIANSYDLDLVFAVNNTVPARCTPEAVTETLTETKPSSYCLQHQVECVDPTNGGSVILTSWLGNGTTLLEIKNRTQSGKLLLSACIKKDIKNNFGVYQIEAVISNGLAETKVTWSFTVINVNEPPRFSLPLYETSIPENAKAGTKPIITLTVTDPDEETPDQSFHITKVTAESLNDADFAGALSEYIKYFNTSREFFVVVNGLNATERNEYRYKVTVEDGMGLKATATVAINITDVNESPRCNQNPVDTSTNILAAVGETVGSISCYDTDLEPKNKLLSYNIIDGDPDDYFNITPAGNIIIGKKLPRLRLYTTGRADLDIQITDGGDFPLSTHVLVTVTVDNKIPVNCNPVIQPPGIWVQDECLTVTMGCSDPTSPDSTLHIRYGISGNYSQGFQTPDSIGATFELCYKLTTSGFYELRVDVDNGLSTYQFRKVVEVRYEEATPVFTKSTFKETVSEFTSENEQILSATATSSNLIGELTYAVIDAESSSGWSEFFLLDSTNGIVTTKKALKELADTVMRMTVEVRDTVSKLKSSAIVEITISDENESPVCDLTDTDITVDINISVDTVIKQFSCSDPDVVANFKQLSYSLTGSTNVNIYFKLVPENDPTSISVKAQLSVNAASYDTAMGDSKASYYITLEVRDNGDPAKVYSMRLTVIVSLLPPPVEWEILELGYSHIFVSWKYGRSDYYQVTNTFQVKLRESNSDQYFSTDILQSDRRFYNTTEIKANTTFEIFISATTQYGTRNTRSALIKTLAIPKITIITATIKFVEIAYTDQLQHPSSSLFKDTAERIIKGVDFRLKGTPGYVGSEVIRYRPGSVTTELAIYVNQSGNAAETKDILAQGVSSGYLGELAVDSTYFFSSIDGGYTFVEKIELGSENVFNGTDISVFCHITTAGYDNNTQFRFWWTFNNNIIRPNSVSRISVTSNVDAVYQEIYKSTLQIKSVTTRDSGTYECFVTDERQSSTSNRSISIEVLSQPVVSLSPRSLTVESGREVTVVCKMIKPQSTTKNFQFLWYRNNSLLQIQEGEEYNENQTTGSLKISRMTVTTVFGCRGRNDAGEGPVVRSYIGVKPAGPVVKLCPQSTFRDTVWAETLPGIIAVESCPEYYTGEITRFCGANGIWEFPRDNCVQDKIALIQQQIKDIKDGSGTVTVTDAMKGLSNATDDETLFKGDLTAAVDTLDETAIASNASGRGQDTEEGQEEIYNYLRVCSNLIDESHRETWDMTIESDGYGANEVARVVEKYIETKTEQLTSDINTSFEKPFSLKNIYAKIGKEVDKSITFPDRKTTLPRWVEDSATEVFAPKETFQGMPAIVYDCVYYRNLSAIVLKKLKRSGNIEDVTKTYDFNSEIVGFNVQGKTANLDPPVVIRFRLYDTNYSNPQCVFWDESDKSWSTDGCYVADVTDDMVTCKCNHFTNFAILMSPGKTPPADILALSIISAVGCAISMFCLLVTLVVHVVLWRIVKSDRAIILLNLCVALLIALASFLGGVGRADNKDVCTAIAVLLHFAFLVVFFLMLAEGIDIAVSIMYVFATKSRILWLIPLSWLIPAVIVAISAGVTKLEGYGNETFCWLSVENGLLWAFVGPAAFVILVNFIIIIIVFRQMFTLSAMLTKSDKEKAKTSLRSLCVLLPIMGLTWVFGIFSVNEDLVVFQYIFAICNSLQGFFIFLFHCFFNKQLRDAIKQRRARKKSLQSFEKSFKNQQSTGTGSSAYQTSEDKAKEINNDHGSTPSSTNPFLEADRQMKELLSKGKKTGNTYDKEANNKTKVEKDKPPVDVALEDVKISNILRESEVMSGTAGISSIFTNQTNSEKRTEDSTENPPEDRNQTRESKASSHAYDYALDSSYPSSAGKQKPAGYEKLLFQQSKSTGYDRIVRSDDNVSARLHGNAKEDVSLGRAITDSRERIDQSRDRLTPSSRSDDDYEARLKERQERLNTVYMPYSHSPQVSQEVVASLPKKYDWKEAKKHEHPKKSKMKVAETGAVKKLSSKKKKEMEKDRSRLYQYQYPYEATYLGQQPSRHSSLENMSGYYINPGYNPYAGMHPQEQTGRPTHQHQQWNPYAWGNQQRRDYW